MVLGFSFRAVWHLLSLCRFTVRALRCERSLSRSLFLSPHTPVQSDGMRRGEKILENPHRPSSRAHIRRSGHTLKRDGSSSTTARRMRRVVPRNMRTSLLMLLCRMWWSVTEMDGKMEPPCSRAEAKKMNDLHPTSQIAGNGGRDGVCQRPQHDRVSLSLSGRPTAVSSCVDFGCTSNFFFSRSLLLGSGSLFFLSRSLSRHASSSIDNQIKFCFSYFLSAHQ